MSAPARHWTAEDVARAKEMRAAGDGNEVIAERLGRTLKAINAKFARVSLTPAQRIARLEYQVRKRTEHRGVLKSNGVSIPTFKPDESLLVERDVRLSAPLRNLTAYLCGDPPVGYSALERRS